MAKKKAARKGKATGRKASSRRKGPSTRKTSSTRKTPLAAFLMKLWSNQEMKDRFKEGRAAREQVVREANLSEHHGKLVVDGCVSHIMAELAGMDTTANTNGTIQIADMVNCGHPQCEAFMNALKPS
jgi:hypothetical protein